MCVITRSGGPGSETGKSSLLPGRLTAYLSMRTALVNANTKPINLTNWTFKTINLKPTLAFLPIPTLPPHSFFTFYCIIWYIEYSCVWPNITLRIYTNTTYSMFHCNSLLDKQNLLWCYATTQKVTLLKTI